MKTAMKLARKAPTSAGAPVLVRAAEGSREAPNGKAFDIAIVASTERLASDGGVLYLKGWDLRAFKQNPRFIAMHDLMGYTGKITDIIAGSVVDIRVQDDVPKRFAPDGRGLVAYIRFANTAFGQEVRQLYLDGDLDMVSVRWDPSTFEVRAPYQEEVDKYGEDLYWVGERQELIEISAVIVGADPGAKALRSHVRSALAVCEGKGIELPLVRASLEEIEEAEPGADAVVEPIEDEPAAVEGEARSTTEAGLTRAIEPSAVSSVIVALQATMDVHDEWMRQGGEIRDAFGAISAALEALLTGEETDQPADDEERADSSVETFERADDIAEPTLEDRLTAAVEALEAVVDKVTNPVAPVTPVEDAAPEAAATVETAAETDTADDADEIELDEEDEDDGLFDFSELFGETVAAE